MSSLTAIDEALRALGFSGTKFFLPPKIIKNYLKLFMKVQDFYRLAQLASACIGVAVGHGLLIAGFIVDSTGEISNSALIAYGETITFAASLFGVDYHYRYSSTNRGYAKRLPDDNKNGNADADADTR